MTAALAATFVGIGLVGCQSSSTSHESNPEQKSSSRPSSGSSTPKAGLPEKSAADLELSDSLPRDAEFLVPDSRGSGDSEFQFTPGGAEYSLSLTCRGPGAVRVLLSTSWPVECDGTPSTVTVRGGTGLVEARIRADARTEWRMAIYDGQPDLSGLGR